MKKGQSAIELVIVIGAVMLFFVTFLGVLGQNISEKTQQKRVEAVQELASLVQNEIAIAAGASEGYQRTFNVPNLILGRDYTISVEDSFLFLKTTDEKIALGLPVQNLTGSIQKGDNTIKKLNNQILLNT